VQYLLVGLPYSGKTTLARKLVERFGFCHVNIDELKREFGYGEQGDDDVPDKVWGDIFDEADRLILKHLELGQSVVSEYAWISREWRDRARRVAESGGFETRTVYLDTPMEETWRRWRENEEAKERFQWSRGEFETYLADFEKLGNDEQFISYRYPDDLERWIRENIEQEIRK